MYKRQCLTGAIWLALVFSTVISALLFAFLNHFFNLPGSIPVDVYKRQATNDTDFSKYIIHYDYKAQQTGFVQPYADSHKVQRSKFKVQCIRSIQS